MSCEERGRRIGGAAHRAITRRSSRVTDTASCSTRPGGRKHAPSFPRSRSGMLTVNALPEPTDADHHRQRRAAVRFPDRSPSPTCSATSARTRRSSRSRSTATSCRADHAARRLHDGDAVEIVTLVGGGSELAPPDRQAACKVGKLHVPARGCSPAPGKYADLRPDAATAWTPAAARSPPSPSAASGSSTRRAGTSSTSST